MHRYETRDQVKVSHLSHLNTLFTGQGSRIYDVVMVRLTRKLYQRVVKDIHPLCLSEGQVLDAGTGPGTLAREIARRFPQLQVEGIDLSEDMIQLAHKQIGRAHV